MSISVIIIRVRCMDVSSVVTYIGLVCGPVGTATRYMDRLVREAIEIRLHPDNFNRDDGFNLSYAWRPIIKILQTSNSAPMANPGQAQVENQPRPQGHRRGLYK
jgi:hypothetical protein